MKIFYKFLFEVDCEYFQWVSSIIGIEETRGETEFFVKLVRRGESGNIRIVKLLLLALKFYIIKKECDPIGSHSS